MSIGRIAMNQMQIYRLPNVKESLHIYGRTGETEGGLFFDHTAAGIEFTAAIEGAVCLSIAQNHTTYYTVWVDGVRAGERLTASGKAFEPVELARFGGYGVHTLRILRQTELQHSISVFRELSFRGHLLVPPRKAMYIEFLGDSITSGYGNRIASGQDGAGSAEAEDGTQTWAFLAAEQLNALCSVVSDSGIGVVNGYVPRTMAQFYAAQSYARPALGAFSPERVPDVVVINLGTNDEGVTPHKEMAAQVRALIQQVRGTYRTAVPIVWASGMMNAACRPVVDEVLACLGGEANRLYSLPLQGDAAGGGGHPGLAGHAANADLLARFLRAKGLAKG